MPIKDLINKALGRRVSITHNERTGTTRKTITREKKHGGYKQKVKERNQGRGATFKHIVKKNRWGGTVDKTKLVQKAPKPNSSRTVEKEKEAVRPSGKKRGKESYKVKQGGKTTTREMYRY